MGFDLINVTTRPCEVKCDGWFRDPTCTRVAWNYRTTSDWLSAGAKPSCPLLALCAPGESDRLTCITACLYHCAFPGNAHMQPRRARVSIAQRRRHAALSGCPNSISVRRTGFKGLVLSNHALFRYFFPSSIVYWKLLNIQRYWTWLGLLKLTGTCTP